MTSLIYYSIMISNLWIGLKNKKIVFFYSLSIVILLLLIVGSGPTVTLNSEGITTDYYNYKLSYESVNISNLSYEFGYDILMIIGNSLNLNFFTFRLLLYTVGFYFIWKSLIKGKNLSVHYVLGLYLIYLVIIDSEQLKNFFALSLLSFGFKYLLDVKFSSSLKYILWVLVASTIHVSFLLYLPLAVLSLPNKRRIAKFVVGLGLGLIIMQFVGINLPFVDILITELSDTYANNYVSTTTGYGVFIPMIMHISTTTFAFISSYRLLRNKFYNVLDHDRKLLETINLINAISVIFSPLFFMNINFYRIIRNLLLINIIGFGVGNYYKLNRTAYKYGTYILSIILMIFWMILDLVIVNNPEDLLYKFTNLNLFFN